MPLPSIRIPIPQQSPAPLYQGYGIRNPAAVAPSPSASVPGPSLQKTKKFRCELCHRRIELVGTNSVEEHKESLSHKHMQILMEYGLWPGKPEQSPIAVVVPGLYNFDNELNGTVQCSLCMCTLKDGTDLLYHQTDPKHLLKVQDRSLAHKISILYSCQVCNCFVGHSKAAMDNHNSTDRLHKERMAGLNSQTKTRYGHGPSQNKVWPSMVPNAPVVGLDLVMYNRSQPSTEVAWQREFRKQFPWLNANLLLHFCGRDRLQRQIYGLKCRQYLDEEGNIQLLKWQKALILLDKRMCHIIEQMHRQNEGWDATFTTEYLDNVTDNILGYDMATRAITEMRQSIQRVLADYDVEFVDEVAELPVATNTNFDVLPTIPPQPSSSRNAAPSAFSADGNLDPYQNQNSSILPPPDPAQDTSQQDIMDLLSSLEKTASQLSKKSIPVKVVPSLPKKPEAPKERSLSEIVDQCMMVLDGKTPPAPAAPSNADVIRQLASSIQNPSLTSLVDKILKPNDPPPRQSIDVADAVAKLAAGQKLTDAETATLSSLSSDKLVQTLNAGMKRKQVKEATKSWEEPRMTCVWGADVDKETRALNEIESRKELMNYYRSLEGDPLLEPQPPQDHGRRSSSRREDTDMQEKDRRPISFAITQKQKPPPVLPVSSSRSRSRDRSRSRSGSYSRSRHHRSHRSRSRSRSRSKRSKHSRRSRSKSRRSRRTRSKSKSKSPERSPYMHVNLAPAPPTAVRSYVPPPVVAYPRLGRVPPHCIPANVPPPIIPGILSVLKMKGSLLTRMMDPDQAFAIRNIIETVATPEDLMAVSLVFQKLPEQALSELLQTVPGVGVFVALIRKAVSVPAAQPHLLSQLVLQQSELTLAGWAITDPYYQLLTSVMTFCSPDVKTLIGKKLLKQIGSLVSNGYGCQVLCVLLSNPIETLKEEVMAAFKNQRVLRMLAHDYSCSVLLKVIDFGQDQSISLAKELFGLEPDAMLELFHKNSSRTNKVFSRLLSVPGSVPVLFQNIGVNPNGLLKLANDKTAEEFVVKFWNALGDQKLLIYEELKAQIEPIILFDNSVCKSLKRIYENGGKLPEGEAASTLPAIGINTSVPPPTFNPLVPPPSLMTTQPPRTSPLLPPGVDATANKFDDDNIPPWRKTKQQNDRDREMRERERREKEKEKEREREKEREEKRKEKKREEVRKKQEEWEKEKQKKYEKEQEEVKKRREKEKREKGENGNKEEEEDDDFLEVVPFRKPTPPLVEIDDD